MVIARLIVKGFVQGVGYRAYVKHIASKLKIGGTVKNLSDGNVEIYCNVPDNAIYNKFKGMLREGPGNVEKIEEYFEGDEKFKTPPKTWEGFNIIF